MTLRDVFCTMRVREIGTGKNLMLLKVSDVAERLNLSTSKVYQLIERNRLPHYRLDGAIRISEEQLADYLERAKQERAEPRPRESRPARPRLKHVRL